MCLRAIFGESHKTDDDDDGEDVKSQTKMWPVTLSHAKRISQLYNICNNAGGVFLFLIIVCVCVYVCVKKQFSLAHAK